MSDLHPNAMDKIGRKIKGSLMNCQISNGWPVYETIKEHVLSLSEEVLKHKKSWLDSADIFSLFYDMVERAIHKEVKPAISGLNGSLPDLIGEQKLNDIAEFAKEFIVSIPRKYDVYIPLSKIPDNLPFDTLELSPCISLVRFKSGAPIPGGGGTLNAFDFDFYRKLEANQLYFRTRVEGYLTNRDMSYTTRSILSQLKIFLQQNIGDKRIFKLNRYAHITVNALSATFTYSIPKVYVIGFDSCDSDKPIVIELSIDLSNFLGRLSINSDYSALAEAEAINNNRFIDHVSVALGECGRLIESAVPESERIKAASQWCLDSYISTNPTLAFLQTCIGLEALLGDSNSRENLTETLADRCSYLLSNSIKGRKQLKDQFKELYKIRSHLVHGTVLELDEHQEWYLHWGRLILETGIYKEIKNLNLKKHSSSSVSS